MSTPSTENLFKPVAEGGARLGFTRGAFTAAHLAKLAGNDELALKITLLGFHSDIGLIDDTAAREKAAEALA